MTEMYGPNTALVERVIQQARNLTAEQAGELYAAWDAALDAAREAAWDAALDAARKAVWDAARKAVWDAVWAITWPAAQGAAGGTTLACVVADLITPEEFAILTGPWVSVMGPLEVTA